MEYSGFIWTGQTSCHDVSGEEIPCACSGQDAEYAMGIPWPIPRFAVEGETVTDLLTGLTWTRDADPAEFPLDWRAALDFVARMNRERTHGFDDWRLPNRRELRSLISHQTRKPALPEGHPFTNVFLGWYWSSTTAAVDPAFAWYVHTEGGRTFYGEKNRYYLVWPVRGQESGVLPATGQAGDSPFGRVWPEPRFELEERSNKAPPGGGQHVALDRLTNLRWRRSANLTGEPVLWEEALQVVRDLNAAEVTGAENSNQKYAAAGRWRLPNINELESLVDMSRHDPALPASHPFKRCREVYWSSTTSMFEPDWAWALYLNKGAVGVGRKRYARFHVWAVSG